MHQQFGPAPSVRIYAQGGPVDTGDRSAADAAVERAYVLESVGNSNLTQRRLNSAEELRSSVEGKPEINPHRLLVLHGLPTDYLEVLRDLLDIDQHFIDAHVRRQSYRPLGRRYGGDANASFAYFDYPELVGCSTELMMTYVSKFDDLMGDPVVHPLSKFGDAAAMFCRASLWTSSKLDVLLLDRPLWRNTSLGIYKARYSSRITRSSSNSKNPRGVELARGDDIPPLETILVDHLMNPRPLSITNVAYLLESIALRQWAGFIEALSLGTPPSPGESAALYWQVQESLERNLESSRFVEKETASRPSASSDWEYLLARLERQTHLLGRLTPSITNIELPSQLRRPARGAVDDADGEQPGQHNSPQTTDENQRSLDRVTYLGGVLLPISVVSGILSMNDDFSPGGGMFFVFWAVTMPLCLLTILVIYADSIRKVEVWIEDSTSGKAADDDTSSSSNSSSTAPPDIEETVLASAAAVPMSMRMRRRRRRQDECTGMPVAPGIIAESSFASSGKSAKERKWKKQQLGWMGACKSIFRIYKLKELQAIEPSPFPAPRRRRATRSI